MFKVHFSYWIGTFAVWKQLLPLLKYLYCVVNYIIYGVIWGIKLLPLSSEGLPKGILFHPSFLKNLNHEFSWCGFSKGKYIGWVWFTHKGVSVSYIHTVTKSTLTHKWDAFFKKSALLLLGIDPSCEWEQPERWCCIQYKCYAKDSIWEKMYQTQLLSNHKDVSFVTSVTATIPTPHFGLM